MSIIENEIKSRYEMMYDDEFKSQIIRFLKARVPLVNINATDERKVKCFFEFFSKIKGYNFYTWDCVRGLKDTEDNTPGVGTRDNHIDDSKNIHEVLKFIVNESGYSYDREKIQKEGKRGYIYIFSDIEYYLNDPVVVRYLKMIYELPTVSALFFVTPETNILEDSSLKNKIRIITPPISSQTEYEDIFSGMLESLGKKSHEDVKRLLVEDKLFLLAKIKGMDLEEAQLFLAVKVIAYHDSLKN